MADGIKRIFSRGRSRGRERPASQVYAADADEIVLPAFGESRYEDTVEGPHPAQGLLPLRGNHSYAIRRNSTDLNESPRIDSPHLHNRPVAMEGPPLSANNPSSRFARFRSRSQRNSRQGSRERDSPVGVLGATPMSAEQNGAAPAYNVRNSENSDRRSYGGFWSSSQRTSRRGSSTREPSADAPPQSSYTQSQDGEAGDRRSFGGFIPRSQRSTRLPSPTREATTDAELTRSGATTKQRPLGNEAVVSSNGPDKSASAAERTAARPKSLEPGWYIRRKPVGQPPEDGLRSHPSPTATQFSQSRNGVAELPPQPLPRHDNSVDGVIDGLDWLQIRSGEGSEGQGRRGLRSAVEPGIDVSKANGGASSREKGPNFNLDSPRSAISDASWATAEEEHHAPEPVTSFADTRAIPPATDGIQQGPYIREQPRANQIQPRPFVRDQPRAADPSAGSSEARPIANGGHGAREAIPSAEEIIRRAKHNSEDTTVYTRVAPAVTHEIVIPTVRHIREERITREYHHHDVYHRILPVRDVEVLPARHFKYEHEHLVEMSPSEAPPGQAHDWVIMETVSTGEIAPGPRRFTAREFVGDEGDTTTEITAEGHPRTDQTWVHPPTLETGAYESGQTVPFVF